MKLPTQSVAPLGRHALALGLTFLGVVGLARATSTPSALHGTHLRTIINERFAIEADGHVLSPSEMSDLHSLIIFMAGKGLKDPNVWISIADILRADESSIPTSILDPRNPRQISADFRAHPIAVTVALLPKVGDLPLDTPIAWTRGLRPDGTWSETSPFAGKTGYVIFAGGQLEWFRGRIQGELKVYGTDRPTSDIREALPPGTRIGEYQPTDEEVRRGSARLAAMRRQENTRQTALLLAWLLPVIFAAVTGGLWWHKRRQNLGQTT